MAINPANSAAALVGGAVVALGATAAPVQKAHALAPGALAAAVGLGLLAFCKEGGALCSAGYGALGVGGVLIYQGAMAMNVASKQAAPQTAVKGMVGLSAIEGAHPKHVLPSQVNLGLSQSVVTPKVNRNLMPSTMQGMSGNRYIPAFGGLYGGR